MIRIIESKFIKSDQKLGQYPISPFSDIAFSGKSNVGKSSLINTILNRKAIAKISSTPGKTRLLNFFEVKFKVEESGESGFVNFVDFPGYGYAKTGKKERESWKKMIEDYFSFRENLAGVISLVDIRHKADVKDIVMIEMLKNRNIPFLVVATKADKIPKTKINARIQTLQRELNLSENNIIPFSSLKKSGKNAVLEWIERLIL